MAQDSKVQQHSSADGAYADYVYAGFWVRSFAWIFDILITLCLMLPVLLAVYGTSYFWHMSTSQGYWDFIIRNFLPVIYVLLFWSYKQATPGKMLLKTVIVDARTGGRPTTKQFVIRYLGYFLSAAAVGLGFFWVIWDKKKQGWHDKLAGTVVLRKKSTRQAAVNFATAS